MAEKKLDEIYEIYKNGVPGDQIFEVITTFLGILFHMSASVITYRLSLNRKEKKYIIYFIVVFISHFSMDLIAQIIGLYELNNWFYFIFAGLVIIVIIIIAIAFFVWKDNNNKEYSDYKFETEISLIEMDD